MLIPGPVSRVWKGLAAGLSLSILFAGALLAAPLLPLRHGADEGTAGAPKKAIGLVERRLAFERNEGQIDRRVDYFMRAPNFALFLSGGDLVFRLDGNGGPALGLTSKAAAVRMSVEGADRTAQAEGAGRLPGFSNYFTGNDPSRWRVGVPRFARVTFRNLRRNLDLIAYSRGRRPEYDLVVRPGMDPSSIRLNFEGTDAMSIDGSGDLVLKTAAGDLRFDKPRLYQVLDGRKQPVRGGYVLTGPGQAGFQVGGYDHRRALTIDPTLSFSSFLGGGTDDYGNGIAVDSSGNAYAAGTTTSSDFPTSVGAYDRCFGTTGTGGVCQNNGQADVFVTKFNSTGSGLSYSTYLGGSGQETAGGISLDSSGNAYVTGTTWSTNFPVTSGAFQTVHNAGTSNVGALCANQAGAICDERRSDAFVTKLNSTGSSLLYSSYLGGGGWQGTSKRPAPVIGSPFLGGDDSGLGIAAATGGAAYIAGTTNSPDFPTKNAYQAALNYPVPGAGSEGHTEKVQSCEGPTVVDTSNNSSIPCYDAFVVRINTSASGAASLVYSTLLGGSRDDAAHAVSVDSSGNAYITGSTSSVRPAGATAGALGFPTTAGVVQPSNSGGATDGTSDAFVAKVNSGGLGPASLVFSTYLGGKSGDDEGNAIVIDSSNLYVAGKTSSAFYPTTAGAYDRCLGATGGGGICLNNGIADAFVTKLNLSGAAFGYSTYLGGTNAGGNPGTDAARGIAVDAGSAIVAGITFSSDFPRLSWLSGTGTNPDDAFVTKLNTAGSGLVCSTDLGGSGSASDGANDGANAVALNGSTIFVTGFTGSPGFQTTLGAYDTTCGTSGSPCSSTGPSNYDAFVAKISP